MQQKRKAAAMAKMNYEFTFGKKVYFGSNIEIGNKKNYKRAAVLAAFKNDFEQMGNNDINVCVRNILNQAQFAWCNVE